jgi:hypothetical protein
MGHRNAAFRHWIEKFLDFATSTQPLDRLLDARLLEQEMIFFWGRLYEGPGLT